MPDTFKSSGQDSFAIKAASKSWMSLISSPDFIKTHVTKSTNDPQFTYHHLLVNCVSLYGFCYDESNEDFKVAAIVRHKYRRDENKVSAYR